MHARGSGEAARRAKLGREPIRVGGGLKKILLGPGPPLDPSLLTKASWYFQRLQIYLGKFTFLSSRWPFISGSPTKAFHWWKAEKPPIFKGDASRTLRMYNILKSIQPVYPFSLTQKFWGVRYARVPTHVSLFLLLIVAPKPVSIKSIRRKPAEKIKKQHRSFMPFIFPIK